jgi:hypothetical protein
MSAPHDFVSLGQLPCRQGDPDDWFIPLDGVLPHEIVEEIQQSWVEFAPAQDDLTENEQEAFAAEGAAAEIEKLEAERAEKRKNAIRACHLDCPRVARLLCLDEGLKPENVSHGVWGGYTEIDRRAVTRKISARQSGRPLDRKRLATAILSNERGVALNGE